MFHPNIYSIKPWLRRRLTLSRTQAVVVVGALAIVIYLERPLAAFGADPPQSKTNPTQSQKKAGGRDVEAERKRLADLETAIRLAGDAKAHAILGTALFGHGKFDKAIAAFREATRLAPGNAQYQFCLSLALSDQEESTMRPSLRDARRFDSIAVAPMPTSPSAMHCISGGSWTKRYPHFARRSGSIRTMTWLTDT